MGTKTVDAWLESQEQRSGVYVNYLFDKDLDDTFEWAERLETILAENKTLPAGVLIAGPEGCGRHTIMANIVQLLSMDPWSFSTEFITGWDLEDDTGSFALAHEKLEVLLEKYRENPADEQDLCLVLDEFGDYPYQDALLKFLEKTVCEYRNRKDEYPKLFLVLFQNASLRVPSILRRMLYACCVQYPDVEHRKRLLQKYIGKVQGSLSVDDMTEKTSGFSYAELWSLIQNVQTAAEIGQNALPQDTVECLINEQKVPITGGDAKERLFRKLEQTLDSLPELLAKLPHTDGSTRPQVSTEELSEPKKLNPLDEGYMDAQREELENLTGHDLANRRFTDDQLKAIDERWEAQHQGQQAQQPTQEA